MKEVIRIVYETVDGKVFYNKEEAEKHEEKINDVKAFRVYAHPDLTEGRSGASFQGYLLVHVRNAHEMFAEEWCYRKYGNKVTFVQGVYGSNAIMTSWRLSPCSVFNVEDSKIIGRLEEDFVDKLWN